MATSFVKQPYGLTLPITHGPSGYFDQSFSVVDQVKSNLINLLCTKKGERRMNPSFGTDLYKVVFEMSNDELPIIIESIVKKETQQWMPYLDVISVVVDIQPKYKDIYAVRIAVTFSISALGQQEIQTVQFAVDKQVL